MKNLPFVIWMIGYLFVNHIGKYINEYLLKYTYSDTTILISSLISIVIWISIGYLLYEKKNSGE